jgi:hypothetical protein
MTTEVLSKLESVQRDCEKFDELLSGLDCQTVALIIARTHGQKVAIVGRKPLALLALWSESDAYLKKIFNECLALKVCNGNHRMPLYKAGQGHV